MKILITGIAGFVGSTLARKLLETSNNIEIIGVDDLSYGNEKRFEDLIDKITFIKLNVKELVVTKSLLDIDLIIHCAAVAPLPDNQENPYLSIEQNVAMCAAISDFATKVGCENIIFFSSGAVYEGSGTRACKETDIVDTKLIYPTSKFLAEQLLKSVANTYGLKVVAIRLFNLYGPNQDYFRKQPPLLGYLIKSYLKNEDITLFASEDAERDYIYIDDLYQLVKKIIEKFPRISEGEFVTVNAGGEKTYSVYDLVAILEHVAGEKINYTKGEKLEFWEKYPSIFNRRLPLNKSYLLEEVDKVAIANIDFAKTYFSWSPKVDIYQGISECLEFARGVLK